MTPPQSFTSNPYETTNLTKIRNLPKDKDSVVPSEINHNQDQVEPLFHKQPSPLTKIGVVENSNHLGGGSSYGETLSGSITYDGPSCKQVLSKMIVYNAFRTTDSSVSTDSSMASHNGIKPSAALLACSGVLDLSALSQSYTILLIVRKFLNKGGCPFCNRRMSEINEWRRSLLQLGIVPVVLHSESTEEAQNFFKELCNPQLRDIWRVSDPHYKTIETFCKIPDSGATPLIFRTPSKMHVIKNLHKLVPTLKEGYFDPGKRYKLEKKMKYETSSMEVVAKMMLIKNDRVCKSWDHKKEDHAPDILGDVIMRMDLNTREFLLGNNGSEEESIEDGLESAPPILEIQSSKQIQSGGTDLTASSNHVEISITEENKTEGKSEQFQIEPQTPPRYHKILTGMDSEIPSPSEFNLTISTNFEKIVTETNETNEDEIMFEEPLSPASPASPTRTLTTLLDSLHMSIDIYKKEKGKFEFTKITPEQQQKELQKKTLEAKRMIEDSKAQNAEESNRQSNGCIPFRLSPNRSKEIPKVEQSSSLESMTSIIHDEKKRKYFKLFSAREYNAESILFWEDINIFYKKLFNNPNKLSPKSKSKIIEHSKRISQRYLLDEDSIFLLNTTKRLKQQVEENLPTQPVHLQSPEDIRKAMELFDLVVDDIVAHVLPDIYVRFVFSTECKLMKTELGLV